MEQEQRTMPSSDKRTPADRWPLLRKWLDANKTPSDFQLRRVIERMEAKKISPKIIARVMRLNPVWREGERLHGWHPGHTVHRFCFIRNVVPLTEFSKKYPASLWRHFKPDCFIKHGKRKYLRREVMEDMPLTLLTGKDFKP
jgi:hypothetical protein